MEGILFLLLLCVGCPLATWGIMKLEDLSHRWWCEFRRYRFPFEAVAKVRTPCHGLAMVLVVSKREIHAGDLGAIYHRAIYGDTRNPGRCVTSRLKMRHLVMPKGIKALSFVR